MDEDNDGRFPDDSLVEIRYPRTLQEGLSDRSAWPWLPGSVLSQCGPEWHVCVEARELAVLDDRNPAPDGTADEDQFPRAVSGTPAKSGASPTGRGGDPRNDRGQLVLLAGHQRRAGCALHSAHRDRHRPPGRRSRLGYLPERDPGRLACGADPRLPGAA